ncbi:hypothetical protein HMN09_00935900 [Mycena chlorophos]|uniref:F-box domain-containing protein n=1 Tax=Mycena chlorophos TaxID=658473 RepID=A0A8H6SJI5_MYCCL|nr:hypothetical protein HMN09_00935900 [Mycena chlorophos]
MHPALGIPEIVHEIALAANARYHNGKTLLALATTCHTFLDPALNELWCDLGSFRRWVQCFPDGLFVYEKVLTGDGQDFTVKRPMLASDWERPLFYAKRVRRLTYGFFTHSTWPVLHRMVMSLPSGCVFPRLLSLGFPITNEPEELIFLRFFLPSTLSSVCIHNCGPYFLDILPTLGQLCPALRDVTLQVHDMQPDERFVQATSDFIVRLHHLRSLTAPTLNWEALQHLAELPNLSQLKLQNLAHIGPSPAPLPSGFPALRHLNLGYTPLPVATSLLSALRNTELCSLDLQQYPCPTKRDMQNFFYTLSSNTSMRTSLADLAFSIVPVRAPDPDDEVGPGIGYVAHDCTPSCALGDSVLRHLHGFAHLTDVYISMAAPLDIDDNTLLDLARAWPELQRLTLNCEQPAPDPEAAAPPVPVFIPKTTLLGLSHFAAHCPDLLSLELSRRIMQRKLTSLDLSASPIAQAKIPAIAQFLSGIFPKAYVDGECNESWKEVQVQVERLLAVRKEEWAWARAATRNTRRRVKAKRD